MKQLKEVLKSPAGLAVAALILSGVATFSGDKKPDNENTAVSPIHLSQAQIERQIQTLLGRLNLAENPDCLRYLGTSEAYSQLVAEEERPELLRQADAIHTGVIQQISGVRFTPEEAKAFSIMQTEMYQRMRMLPNTYSSFVTTFLEERDTLEACSDAIKNGDPTLTVASKE